LHERTYTVLTYFIFPLSRSVVRRDDTQRSACMCSFFVCACVCVCACVRVYMCERELYLFCAVSRELNCTVCSVFFRTHTVLTNLGTSLLWCNRCVIPFFVSNREVAHTHNRTYTTGVHASTTHRLGLGLFFFECTRLSSLHSFNWHILVVSTIWHVRVSVFFFCGLCLYVCVRHADYTYCACVRRLAKSALQE